MAVTVQSLWIGSELSSMERLSIRSFLSHGHEYHLYVYRDVGHVPNGTITYDANEVLPASKIFQYHDYKSYAGFANYFRYKLLLDKGGWWVDLDVICLKPFEFDPEYVFGTEMDTLGRELPNCGTLRIPKGAPIARYMWETCCEREPDQLKWGETGPALVYKAIQKFCLWQYLQPAEVFYPINYFSWEDIIFPGRTMEFGSNTYAVHLWNEMWRRSGLNKDEQFAPGCLYERLKRMYSLTAPGE